MRISKMPKFDSQNPAQTPSVVIGRALHFIGRKVRVWPEEEATAEEAYRYAIRHDILGRQDLSQAAGAAAEHERADAREPERGRVEPRVVRFTKHDDDTCERMSTLRRGRKAPPRRRDPRRFPERSRGRRYRVLSEGLSGQNRAPVPHGRARCPQIARPAFLFPARQRGGQRTSTGAVSTPSRRRPFPHPCPPPC